MSPGSFPKKGNLGKKVNKSPIKITITPKKISNFPRPESSCIKINLNKLFLFSRA